MRERWFGATGLRVPEIAVEGRDIELPDARHARLGGELHEALIVEAELDQERLAAAHAAGIPVIARAATADGVQSALAHPEVACVVVPASAAALQTVDLTELTYG